MNGSNFRISLNGSSALRLNLVEHATEQIRMVSPVSGSFSGKISIDTTEGWNSRLTYVPARGEIIIYSDRHVIDDVNYPGIKIGDGNAYVVDLPYFGDDETNRVINIINMHINNAEVHVSQEDRAFWNAKLNFEIENENLVFTRN